MAAQAIIPKEYEKVLDKGFEDAGALCEVLSKQFNITISNDPVRGAHVADLYNKQQQGSRDIS